MKIKKIRFDKIKVVFGKLPRILGERAFLAFLGLLVVFLVFGAFLFYKYIFLVERAQPKIIESSLQFNEGLFQKILEKSRDKQKKFEETETKKYPDPFTKIIIIEEER